MLIPTSQPTALLSPPERGTLYEGLREKVLITVTTGRNGGCSPVFWVPKNAR